MIHKNLLKDSLQSYLLFEPIKNSFVNDECCKIYFYILYVEIKYIHSGIVNFDLLNKWHASSLKDITRKQTVKTNYITEIVSIKPYIPNRKKSSSDTLVYEGLMMTRRNTAYRFDNQIKFTYTDDITNFFVPVVDKKYNFDNNFSKGVYITLELTSGSLALEYLRNLIPYLLQVKTINTKLPVSLLFDFERSLKSDYKRMNVNFYSLASFIWQEHYKAYNDFQKKTSMYSVIVCTLAR
jgi:hypothetical protein